MFDQNSEASLEGPILAEETEVESGSPALVKSQRTLDGQGPVSFEVEWGTSEVAFLWVPGVWGLTVILAEGDEKKMKRMGLNRTVARRPYQA